MFGILSEELLKASKCELHFIHETLSTCLEVWHLLRVKYRGVRCRLKKGCRDRRCLGWFVPTEQRPDKPQKRMAKKLGIILLHMCVSPRHSLHVRRSLGEFSRSRMLTCNIFRYCSFFFFNRQFILPSEKSDPFRRKRDWFCVVFGFSSISFEFLNLFVLRQEEGLNKVCLFFLPSNRLLVVPHAFLPQQTMSP